MVFKLRRNQTGKDKTKGEDEPLPPITERSIAAVSLALGYEFKDKNRPVAALTHRSAQRGESTDYERLEFLGDAVLDLVVAHLLYELHPAAPEGDLSKMRAALVNSAHLASVAKVLGLGPHIRLSRGEMESGGADRASILADVVEALIGAVYLDGGFPEAYRIARKLFETSASSVEPRDPKTELQEIVQAYGCEGPKYYLDHTEGPEHSPTFVSVVLIDDQIVGRGTGTTKKQSQQEAASEALRYVEPYDDLDKKALELS